MNDAPESEPVVHARPAPGLAPPGGSLIGLVVRTLARAWVVLLLLGASALSGLAVAQAFQKQAELQELRREPGPSAYAVVAYRAELQRQIDAIKADRLADAVPAPPARPPLMEEIDMARARNSTILTTGRSESLGTISAPP